MGRFLLFFSYVGTNYSGMQIQRARGQVVEGIQTVQGVLEEKLRLLKPTNQVQLKTSSRTDKNVHALCNSCHVDLFHRRHPWEFNPNWITAFLNKQLNRSAQKIRILSTVRVADTFSSRHYALERSYVYRLALVKKKDVFSDPSWPGMLPWPAPDAEFSSRVYVPFDMDRFLRAAELLCGTHDLRSFSTRVFSPEEQRGDVQHGPLSVSVHRGQAWMKEQPGGGEPAVEHWEVHFTKRWFLYRQVRRMVGAMVSVAQGRMDLARLSHMIHNPSAEHAHNIETQPGNGLMLKHISYPQEVINFYARSNSIQANLGPAAATDVRGFKKLREIVPPPPPGMYSSEQDPSPPTQQHSQWTPSKDSRDSQALPLASNQLDLPQYVTEVDVEQDIDADAEGRGHKENLLEERKDRTVS